MAEAWPAGVYNKAKMGDLILVALAEFRKESIGFEDLLARCFLLFPGRFSFSEHEEWPDARRLGRPLRLLREGRMVEGSPEDGFVLTEKGRERASLVDKELRQRTFKI